MTERIEIADMPGIGRQPHPDVPLGIYVHYKIGEKYLVIGGSLKSDDEEQTVLVEYVSLKHGYSGCRPVANFREELRLVGGGKPVARFQLDRALAPAVVLVELMGILARQSRRINIDPTRDIKIRDIASWDA